MTNISSTHSSWIIRPRPVTSARLRLFCLPYAGGSASIFRNWSELLPSDIEGSFIELPGRGSRLLETPIGKIFPLVQALSQAILPYLDIPFAIFGHSMGALIGYELARQLRRQHNLLPLHLFVSGFRAAQILYSRSPSHHLPDEEFLEKLRGYRGTPESILKNAEVMQLMLPAIRADVSICETYIYMDEPPLPCPITAFGGWQDKLVSRDELAAWNIQTYSSFSLHMFPGDHFFINSAQKHLVRTMSKSLAQYVTPTVYQYA
jgi:medium-chain acyl-[acyl-carrier-protein] hydrolase